MSNITNSESLYLHGGKIGVLFLHGFTGSPASVRPWALGIHAAGYTVSAPRVAGHGTHWKDLNRTTWQEMFESVQVAFDQLQQDCERVFVAGFSVGGALALRLVQQRGQEIEGLVLLNPSIYDDRKFFRILPAIKYIVPGLKSSESDIAQPEKIVHGYDRIPLRALDSIRNLWRRVENDLYLVDIPLLVAYSLNDHVVNPSCSITIIDRVSSATVREIIFEKSFHNVSLDFEVEDLINESEEFFRDVLTGEFDTINEDDEEALINAEFNSIVSELSLDESSPTTYLDELDRIDQADGDHFVQPNPKKPEMDFLARIALGGLIGGPAYLALSYFTGFTFFGTGPWLGVIAFTGGVIATIMKLIRPDDDFGDGVIL